MSRFRHGYFAALVLVLAGVSYAQESKRLTPAIYGVVLDEGGEGLDLAATEKLRNLLRDERLGKRE